MPEPIPEEAVREATEAYSCAWTSGVSGHETLVRIVLEAAAPILAAHERRQTAERITAYEDLLGSIWLYISWREVTRKLTTEQKEMFADAVDAWSLRCWRHSDVPSGVDRWWRDDAPTRQSGDASDPR